MECIDDQVPHKHQFVCADRIITYSLTVPSGTANRAMGSMPAYKEAKQRDPKYNTFDFRVEQYRSVFFNTWFLLPLKCQLFIMKHFSIFVLFLFFTSCATMFNKRSQEIRFITNEPTQLIVAKDTLKKIQAEHYVFVKCSRAPLPIQVQGDSISKKILLHSNNSIAYIANFIYPSILNIGIGWLVDHN